MKDSARILDATAGNRCMWRTKEHPLVLWIDIEPDLNTKPDMMVDCTSTPFENEQFHTIFFDPPHEWGRKKNTGIFTTPSKNIADEKWPQWKRPNPRYYGTDKYPNKKEFLKFIDGAQSEFYRILSNDGCLWIKWNERKIKLNELLSRFQMNWHIMLRIPGIKHGE